VSQTPSHLRSAANIAQRFLRDLAGVAARISPPLKFEAPCFVDAPHGIPAAKLASLGEWQAAPNHLLCTVERRENFCQYPGAGAPYR
jgi:hypothetical protein